MLEMILLYITIVRYPITLSFPFQKGRFETKQFVDGSTVNTLPYLVTLNKTFYEASESDAAATRNLRLLST